MAMIEEYGKTPKKDLEHPQQPKQLPALAHEIATLKVLQEIGQDCRSEASEYLERSRVGQDGE